MTKRTAQTTPVSRLLFCLMLVTLLFSSRSLFAQTGTSVVAIDAGGAASGIWVADEDYSGGSTSYTSATISTSLVANPAPQEVYQTERYGDFTYTIPNLTAGASYTVNLSFAEIYWTAAGKREFNVLINGTQVLTNFDVFATAGGENIAIVKAFTATASASGTITIQFTTGAADLPKVSGIQVLSGGTAPAGTDVLDINSAGPTVGSYVADEDFAGGTASSTTATISTANVSNPAPAAVYQTQRYGNFTYTLPGFTAGTSYTVRLHFAEIYWTAAGSRVFDVYINGIEVLTNFDIFAAAGGENIAIVEQFSATANASGQIVIQFTTVKDNAAVNGIEIETSGGTAPTAATPTFSPAAGTYTSAQSVTISDATAGATIYYTTNGTAPTTSSAVYSGPIAVSASETLEAIATASGYTTSAVATAAYTINITMTPAATPTFSPAAGTYSSAQSVTISDATSGAKIYYTTNGTTPTTSSALYSGPITVSGSETLEAIATATGYTTSAVATAAYTITAASGGTDVLDINAAGPAVGSYVADEDFAGGTESSTTNTISLAGVTNPAPEAVYQTQRFGNFTYTIPGLTAGASYTVRLHFAEFYWDAAGSRLANVTINGTQVLTNFDIFAAAGGQNIAVVEQFNTTASTAGQIVIQFTTVKDNAAVNGIEIETSGSAPSAPAPPTGLTATAVSSSQINLSWTASTTAGVEYEVFQNGNLITTVTGTTYSNSGLAASTTYSYTVEATDSGGTSTADGPVSATTLAAQTGSVAPPTSLMAVGSSSQQIDLRWVASTTPAPNTAPVNYLVYRNTTPNFTPSAANLMGTTIGITNYLDSNYPATLSPPAGPGVQPSTTYYYQVVASTSAGTSVAATASATTLPATPSTAAPSALTGLTAMAESANEIDLLWNSTNSGVGTVVTEYYVYRSTTTPFTPAASNHIGTTKSNWFQDELVSASTQYYYQVLANSSLGVSPSSATVSAITPALNPNLWGGAPFFDGSGIPATPAGDTLMVKFLNRTNGKYTNAQITYTATINGNAINSTIAANPYYAMGPNSAGRMYFFLNDPTLAEDNTDYWDFIEFTVGATSINMDTTRVDAFGVKIAFNLTCGDGTNIALGENQQTFMEDRSVTFQRYANAAPSTPGGDFQSDLVYAPYRIIEPGAAGFNAGGADQNYYANYISDIWSFNGITIPLAGPNGSGLGTNPDLSAAIFRHTAPISGTPEFNSAGDLTNQGMWGNPASFYQQEPYGHYAQWIEAQAINMQQYAFPYNDAGGYSSDIGCSNPKTLLVAIGW